MKSMSAMLAVRRVTRNPLSDMYDGCGDVHEEHVDKGGDSSQRLAARKSVGGRMIDCSLD